MRSLLAVGLLLVFAICSCGGDPEPEDDAAAFDPAFLPARLAYRTHCAACHGKRGKGATHLFPPLRGSEWVNGDPGIPIRAVLHGVEGALTVEGVEYMNKMAPLGHVLTDGQIAEILTYVRASWGNVGSEVTSGEVARVRASTRGRTNAWTEAELRPLLESRPDGEVVGDAPP